MKEEGEKEREGERGKSTEKDAETKEREDMANDVILHGGHIQGPKNGTMGGHWLPW